MKDKISIEKLKNLIRKKEKKDSDKPIIARPVGKHAKAKFVLKVIGLGIAAVIAIVALYSAAVIIQTPKIDPDNVYSYLNEGSTIYDSKKKEIGSVYAGEGSNRQMVDYKDIPEDMINAIVSIEDKTFWKHHGFNIVRIFGAIRDSVFNKSQISGTSTITQQLARNLYLSSERSMTRKIKEAYYTMCLERHLSKEQIIEAYLNTISLGYGCYGIESAAQAYFSKDTKDLSLLECAALAAIPQSPTNNALILRYEKGSIDADDKNIISSDNDWIYYYNGKVSENRRNTVLKYMCNQGYITEKQRDKALKKSLKKRIKVSHASTSSFASYFSDYLVEEVVADLQKKNKMTEEEAREMVYMGGLKIYTSLDSKAQEIVEEEYANTSNFPGTANLSTDYEGNIINNGVITLYKYSNYFDENDVFTLQPSEYKFQKDGSLILKKDKRLNFYEVDLGDRKDYNIEFKNMYKLEYGFFYSIEGGIISIDAKYKTLTDKGNIKISPDYFKDKPNTFQKTDNGLVIDSAAYTLRQQINEPQSAMVILDNETGQIKAMIGGRGSSGRLLYNRATSPRQPGSSIKPLAVYAPALQQGADSGGRQKFSYRFETDGNQSTYGTCWTATSYINDSRMVVEGEEWPKNWYNGFRGYMSLRRSVEQSVNVNAVKVFSEVGSEYSADMLKKFGISSVVEKGKTNDMNASALALGGMTKGVSPLEMAGAYAALANLGKYNEPKAYTKIVNRNGDEILKSNSKETKVLDAGVAWIMDDILHTTVTNGIANSAYIGVQPVAGKTGTTTDNYDAWFCGFTPQYTAALWIGNDVNIELTEGSASAARLWSTIMRQVTGRFDYEDFKEAPSNVVSQNGEFFIKGTEQYIQKPKSYGDVDIEVCTSSGELATPSCPETTMKRVTVELDEYGGDLEARAKSGKYYCHIHNPNMSAYPISPAARERIREQEAREAEAEKEAEKQKKADAERKEAEKAEKKSVEQAQKKQEEKKSNKGNDDSSSSGLSDD